MAIPLDQETLEVLAEAHLVPDEHRSVDPDGRLLGFMIINEVTHARAWLVIQPSVKDNWCCEKVYACPSNGELECPDHGGFDVCCGSDACPGSEKNLAARRI